MRSDVADNLEIVYESRNRLAHHEPVLYTRFTEAIACHQYLVQRLEARTPGDQTPLYRLIEDDLTALVASAVVLHAELDAHRTSLDLRRDQRLCERHSIFFGDTAFSECSALSAGFRCVEPRISDQFLDDCRTALPFVCYSAYRFPYAE